MEEPHLNNTLDENNDKSKIISKYIDLETLQACLKEFTSLSAQEQKKLLKVAPTILRRQTSPLLLIETKKLKDEYFGEFETANKCLIELKKVGLDQDAYAKLSQQVDRNKNTYKKFDKAVLEGKGKKDNCNSNAAPDKSMGKARKNLFLEKGIGNAQQRTPLEIECQVNTNGIDVHLEEEEVFLNTWFFLTKKISC